MPKKPKCDLCEDGTGSPLVLHSKCHFMAPLKATLEGTTLTLQCYVPECGKIVATFEVKQ